MSNKNIIENTYNLIRNLPRLSLGNVQPFKCDRTKKIIRRGDHRGNKCGHGKSQRVAHFAIGSECKKMPFFMKFPKEDYYKNLRFKREYPPISLQSLQTMIDLNRLDITKPIDLAAICKTGLFDIDPGKKHYGFNLTDEGAHIFSAKINIEVQWASEAVIAAIERNGGVITCAYYDVRSLTIMRNPMTFFEQGESIPRRLPPPEDAILFYTGASNRGYLANPEEISWERLVLAQKYGYKLPKIEDDPDYEMLMQRKDPRQIFYGLEPGWVVNLKDRIILKSLDPTLNAFFKS